MPTLQATVMMALLPIGVPVSNGGTDNGAPGLRPEYSGRYYAAFVLDPDGNNVEAVFHAPLPAQ
jgi:hypothetical protein